MSKETRQRLQGICFLIFFIWLITLLTGDAFPADLKKELPTIKKAAIRNGIKVGSADWYILLAIRKAENGKKFKEFGILHPKCDRTMKSRPNDTLDIQAGWCAATIKKNRRRWNGKGSFIVFLGSRYCPPDAHLLNKHWIGNVNHWVKRLRRQK